MKLLLIFKNGELIHQVLYKTKKEALGNYRLFKKHGKINPVTFEVDKTLTYELI